MIIEMGKRYFNSIDELYDKRELKKFSVIFNVVCSSILITFLYCALFVLYMLSVLIISIILNSAGVDVTGISVFYISSLVVGPYLAVPVFLVSIITIIKKSRSGYGRYLRMCGFETISEDCNGKYILK